MIFTIIGKIIKLKNEDYIERLNLIINELEEWENKLGEFAANLAVLDKWKEWSAEQSIGTYFEFSQEALFNTGDKNVDAIMELKEEVLEIISKLK